MTKQFATVLILVLTCSTSQTVILRAVLSGSGQVTNIRIIQRLPHGLNQKAFEAAQQIKFVPATKDGHPVSQYTQLEYKFFLL